MKNKLIKIYCKGMKFLKKEDGINTIEILIIAVALIALAVLFWDKISDYGNQLINKLENNINDVVK